MKKFLLWLFGIIFLLIIGFGTYIYFNAHRIVNTILRTEIIDKYNESPDAKYLISLEKIKLNFITGSVKVSNINVIPKDSLVTLQGNLTGDVIQSTSLNIHIKEISLQGFDYLNAINNRIITVNKFTLHQPQIYIYQHEGIPQEEEQHQDTIDLRSIFLTHFDTFQISEIAIADAFLSINKVNRQNDTLNQFSINHLSYQIDNVLANSRTLYSEQYFSFKRYSLGSKKLEVALNDGGSFSIGSIYYHSEEKNLQINKIDFTPGKTAAQFFSKLKYRKAWIKASLAKLQIEDIDLLKVISNKGLIASSLTLKKPNLSIHSNANIPLDTNQIKPMLGQSLVAIPIPYFIDNLLIENATISLDMMGKATENHGKLQFNKMNITGRNLTNIPSYLSENKFLTIQATTKVNNTGKVNANLKIDLQDPKGQTQFNVSATQLKLKNLSSVLKPILRISILDGTIVSLKTTSSLNAYGATGKMDVHYENLRLQLEAKDLAMKPGFFNSLASGLANGIIKTNNVPGAKNYHQGAISFTKKNEDSFFKMLWLIQLHGLEDSILGSDARDQRIKNKKQKQENKTKSKSNKKWKIKF